ncbi:uncharacterized protein BXZ73DRAFT_44142 [Epithele typhae]|uniref:uncharacterized protein n=1 Tax=Epithele typhae TaxID=378194 RepID=UPI0020083BC4|nr:uncharacterized protein BXZ73DRAFT_44142 [Epithele typhae]KAH9939034.1 hypothetical protein BXZ73DRAFT_44142 [Epithele typhae]
MARKWRNIPPPSRLSQILAHLKQEPRPVLTNLKSLHLTYASRNNHFGARHFVKDDLPRIRHANPSLDIKVDRLPVTKEDTLEPKMVVELENGTTHTVNMEGKWSNTIFSELMDVAAGPWWQQWKAENPNAPPTPMSVPRPQKKTGAAAVLP